MLWRRTCCWGSAISQLVNGISPSMFWNSIGNRILVTLKYLFMLQQAYVHGGNQQASLAAAAELLKSHPDSPYTHQMLGEAYDRDGDVDHAAEEFQLAIAADPSAPQLHFMLGYVYWRWKRYAEAVAPLKQRFKSTRASLGLTSIWAISRFEHKSPPRRCHFLKRPWLSILLIATPRPDWVSATFRPGD